jgi:hypothetical protein
MLPKTLKKEIKRGYENKPFGGIYKNYNFLLPAILTL